MSPAAWLVRFLVCLAVSASLYRLATAIVKFFQGRWGVYVVREMYGRPARKGKKMKHPASGKWRRR